MVEETGIGGKKLAVMKGRANEMRKNSTTKKKGNTGKGRETGPSGNLLEKKGGMTTSDEKRTRNPHIPMYIKKQMEMEQPFRLNKTSFG